MIYYGKELYHHGIKGQKWGDRNYQYEDGSLTPEGKKRYGVGDGKYYDSNGKKISKHRAKIIQKYKDAGLSTKKAEQKAADKIKTEVAIGAIGGLTVAAATALVIKKKWPEYVDRTVKKDSILKRIDTEDSSKLHDEFYAARNKHDVKRYEGFLGFQRLVQKPDSSIYQKTINAKDNIRIASDRNARKAYYEILDSNEGLRNLGFAKSKKGYEEFNRYLVSPELREQGYTKSFYDNLRKKGYGGIRDINDIKYSGYKARDPLIMFQKGSFEVSNIRNMGFDEIMNKRNKEHGKRTLETLLPKMGISAGIITTVALAKKSKEKDMKHF